MQLESGTGCTATGLLYLLSARISSASLLAIAYISPTVGGSLTVMTSVFTALLLLLVPLIALLSCIVVTLPAIVAVAAIIDRAAGPQGHQAALLPAQAGGSGKNRPCHPVSGALSGGKSGLTAEP